MRTQQASPSKPSKLGARALGSRSGARAPRTYDQIIAAGGRLLHGSSFALALDATANTAWVQISRTGSWKGHLFGEFELGKIYFESAIAQFDRQVNELVFDYEHMSLFPGAYGAPAAGWSGELQMRGAVGEETLWANVEFTARAADAVRAQEYRYISPVWCFGMPDRVTGAPVVGELHSVALTNVPFLDGMAPIELALSRRESRRHFSFSRRALASGGSMDPEETLNSVREALGLPGDATIDQIKTALDGLDQLAKAQTGGGDAGGGDGGGEAPPPPPPMNRNAVAPPAAGGEQLTASEKLMLSRIEELEAEKNARAKAAREEAVETLIASGRALPAEKEGLLELAETKPELFAKLTDSRPVITPAGQRVAGANQKGKTKGGPKLELTAREHHFYLIARNAGLRGADGKPMTDAQLREHARAKAAANG